MSSKVIDVQLTTDRVKRTTYFESGEIRSVAYFIKIGSCLKLHRSSKAGPAYIRYRADGTWKKKVYAHMGAKHRDDSKPAVICATVGGMRTLVEYWRAGDLWRPAGPNLVAKYYTNHHVSGIGGDWALRKVLDFSFGSAEVPEGYIERLCFINDVKTNEVFHGQFDDKIRVRQRVWYHDGVLSSIDYFKNCKEHVQEDGGPSSISYDHCRDDPTKSFKRYAFYRDGDEFMDRGDEPNFEAFGACIHEILPPAWAPACVYIQAWHTHPSMTEQDRAKYPRLKGHDENGNVVYLDYVNTRGKNHRIDGPAVLYGSTKKYFIDGEDITHILLENGLIDGDYEVVDQAALEIQLGLMT